MTNQAYTLVKANVCPRCGDKLVGKVCRNGSGTCGENYVVPFKHAQQNKRNAARRERDQIMRDCGLIRVRGALGGIYWE